MRALLLLTALALLPRTAVADGRTRVSGVSGASPVSGPTGGDAAVGYPWRGRLHHGRRLQPRPSLRFVERYLENDRFFGTGTLVRMLERASHQVFERHRARLAVGELSTDGGGAVVGHRSHQTGLDVDLGFFLKDATGDWVEAPYFVPVNRFGVGTYGAQPVVFDVEANWALVRALLTDREAQVQHIFCANSVRRRLLDYAAEMEPDADLVHRAGFVLRQPGGGAQPHRDHFHVRIFCPPSSRESCRSRGPYWDWIPRSHTPFWNMPEVGPWQ